MPRLSDARACLEAETPSLVLLDLNLPDSHGADTFRRMREKAPNVPVVILSGQDDEAWRSKLSTREYRTTWLKVTALVCGAPRAGETVWITLSFRDPPIEILRTLRHTSVS